MKVGDYVRTKYGNIGKITNLYKQFSQVEYQDNQTRCDTNENNILKSSPNIIDLIEVGDYVNGYKVIDIVKGFKVIIDKLELDTTTGLYHNIGIKDIKSILTKEQFEGMEYKIND